MIIYLEVIFVGYFVQDTDLRSDVRHLTMHDFVDHIGHLELKCWNFNLFFDSLIDIIGLKLALSVVLDQRVLQQSFDGGSL